MVSTRSAITDEPAKAEQTQDAAHIVKPEPSEGTSSPATQKRKDAPTDEQSENKRRQLTPPGDIEDQTLATPEQTAVDKPQTEPGVSGDARNGANTTATPQGASFEHGELDHISRALLKTFTHSTFEYLTQIVSRPRSRKGQEYRQLYEKFVSARNKLPVKDRFMDTTPGSGLSNDEPFVRRTNIVTFAASMLGSRDASFRQLNQHFFATFVGKSGRLLQQHAEILLGLKTQAYISQAVERGGLREDILNDLFPSDMASKLLALRPESTTGTLVSSEQKFIKQLTNRRRSLSQRDTPQAISELREQYPWNEVLTNMIGYIKQHFEEIAQIPADQIKSINEDGERVEDIKDLPIPTVATSSVAVNSAPSNGLQKTGFLQTKPSTASPLANVTSNTNQQDQGQQPQGQPPLKQEEGSVGAGSTSEEFDAEKLLSAANQAADEVLRSLAAGENASQQDSQQGSQSAGMAYQTGVPVGYTASQSGPIPPQYALAYAQHNPSSPGVGQPYSPQSLPNQGHPSGQPQNATPNGPDGQSQPTHQLYEMARQATNGRSTQTTPRRSGTQSQRRPWTSDEEQALMQGLDQVKGPHWSMILQLYGPGGKISEVLKDRNQVQLKDKARNLKLWFLKSGVEVPVNLKSVTGELKTRAPAAVRNAAAQAAASGAHTGQNQHSPAQTQSPHNYQPMASPYAPTSASPYAPSNPVVTTSSGDNAQTATVANGSANATAEDTDDFWKQAADDAAAQAYADLQALMAGVESTDPAPGSATVAVEAQSAEGEPTPILNDAAVPQNSEVHMEQPGETDGPTSLHDDPFQDTTITNGETETTITNATDGEPGGAEMDDAAIQAAAEAAAAFASEELARL